MISNRAIRQNLREKSRCTSVLPRVLLAGCLVLLSSAVARAQPAGQLPPSVAEVGVTEHVGDLIPLDLPFHDEHGNEVRLRAFFQEERPVLLTLNYFRCPMLCTLQLNGLVEAMKELKQEVGEDFAVVSISFDPSEKSELARRKKRGYVKELRRSGAKRGWHFLTGAQSSITALTDAVGFRYRWDDRSDQWAHAAVLIACTPQGRIYSVQYDPRELESALAEAVAGSPDSSSSQNSGKEPDPHQPLRQKPSEDDGNPAPTRLQQILLYCFHYDPESSGYVMGVVRAGSLLVCLLLVVSIILLFRRDFRRRREARSEGNDDNG
jgi:protein SCO1/2